MIRRAMCGLIIVLLILWRAEFVEGGIDLVVETPSHGGRIDPLSGHRPFFRPALQYPFIGLPRSLTSGAILAQTLLDSSDLVTVTGWFHIIWNDVPHYGLVNDEGEWVDLLVEERILTDAGGPLALNRKWVRITGRRSETDAKAIQVRTINPEERGAK